MINLIVLLLELLFDLVGLITGSIVLFTAHDSRLRLGWGLLSTSLSLLLVADNVAWLIIYASSGEGLSPWGELLLQHLSLWHIIRTVVFFQIFSLFPMASLRPGWMTTSRITLLCMPVVILLCIACCYELFSGEITPLYSFQSIFDNWSHPDVRVRTVLFVASVILPSCNFLFPVFRSWIPFRRRMSRALYFYMICYAMIMSAYIWLMLGTSGWSFNLFGLIVILPTIYLNLIHLHDDNPLSLPPAPNNPETEIQTADIEVAPAILELSRRLEHFMKEQSAFTKADYSIYDLVQDLDTNEYRLNKALRYCGFTGFRDLINYYRLLRFKQTAEENPNLTVKELMFSSGFSSRSSFYRYFSAVEHLSPTEYLEQLRREP